MSINTGKLRVASRDTFPHTAGQYLYKHGPMTERRLFEIMGDTVRADGRDKLIHRCLVSGWFRVTDDGRVDCSEFARAHYDKLAGIVPVEYVGQIAAPRVATAYAQPPLSKKYLINSRGPRQDVPTWSVRPAGFGFKTAGGGEA
jgi:hypothetical protein